LNRIDVDARLSATTTSARLAPTTPPKEPSSNENRIDSGETREGRDGTQQEQISDDHGDADVGSHDTGISRDATCGLGECLCE